MSPNKKQNAPLPDNSLPPPPEAEEKAPDWTPASPIKRLWAWVGVVYMVILVLLTTFALSHGSYLTGIGPLMLVPALCGLGVAPLVLHRTGRWRGGKLSCGLLAAAGFLLALFNLLRGVPALLEQL